MKNSKIWEVRLEWFWQKRGPVSNSWHHLSKTAGREHNTDTNSWIWM